MIDVSYFHLSSKIWRSGWFLDMSPTKRIVFLYILTNSQKEEEFKKFNLPLLCEQVGVSRDDANAAIRELHYRWIICSKFPPEMVDIVDILVPKKYFLGVPVCVSDTQDLRTELSHAKKVEIHVRDNYTCVYCGAESEEIDHVIPLSRGGDNSDKNLVAACKSCNRKKSDKLLSELGWKPLNWRFRNA